MRTYCIEYNDDNPDVTRKKCYTEQDADTFTIDMIDGAVYVTFYEFPPDDDGEMSPVGMIPYNRIISITSPVVVNKKEGDSE